MPPSALRWVEEDQNVSQHEAGRFLSWRLGAAEVVAALPSRESFEALLNFGLRLEGRVLQRSVELLGQEAASLIRDGDGSIAERLFQVAESSEQPWQRLAAIGAIGYLASEGLLPPGAVDQLARLIDRGKMTGVDRSHLVRAVAHLPSSAVSEVLLRRLREEARGGGEESVRWGVFVAIARFGALEADMEILRSEFGLSREGKAWKLDETFERPDYWVNVVGAMYLQRPTLWARPFSQVLRRGSWSEAERAAAIVRAEASAADRKNVPEVVKAALVARSVVASAPWGRLGGVLRAAGQVAGVQLARSRARTSWRRWEERHVTMLAEALGEAQNIDGEASDLIVDWLLEVIEYPVYSTRAAAYRAIKRLAPEKLQAAHDQWAASANSGERERAAESAAWVELPAWEILEADVEPSVRAALSRSRVDHRNRGWAEQYCERLRIVNPESNLEILAAWPYAEALKRVGDDETIERLRSIQTLATSSNTRKWLSQIIGGVATRWQDVLKERDRERSL